MVVTHLKWWFENQVSEEGTPLFPYVPMCNIEKSCCPQSKTEFIDFDAVAKWDARDLSSVDCLYLSNKEVIYLLEMKGWSDFVKWQLSKTNSPEECISEQVKKHQFESKLDDTLHILETIALSQDIGIHLSKRKESSKDFRFRYRKTPKCYIYVSDIKAIIQNNGLKGIMASLNMLANTNSKQIKYLEQIDKESEEHFSEIQHGEYGYQSLQKPFRLDCSEIDDFFADK